MRSVARDGYVFKVSTRAGKKYDVFKDGAYLVSFGDAGYQHYRDRIGLWSHADHGDAKRRASYWARHARDNLGDKNSAGYFAWHYLW